MALWASGSEPKSMGSGMRSIATYNYTFAKFQENTTILSYNYTCTIYHISGCGSWIQRYHTFSFGHNYQAHGASCGILYIYLSLVSCPFYTIPISPFRNFSFTCSIIKKIIVTIII